MSLITAVRANQVFVLTAVTCHYRSVLVFKDRINKQILSPLNHEPVLNRVLNMTSESHSKPSF